MKLNATETVCFGVYGIVCYSAPSSVSRKSKYQRKENTYNDSQLQNRVRNCSLLDTPNHWISFLISQVCSYCYLLLLLSQNRGFGKKSSSTSGFYR